MIMPRRVDSSASHLLLVEPGVRTLRRESLARGRNRPNQNKLTCVRTMAPIFPAAHPLLGSPHPRSASQSSAAAAPARDNQ